MKLCLTYLSFELHNFMFYILCFYIICDFYIHHKNFNAFSYVKEIICEIVKDIN